MNSNVSDFLIARFSEFIAENMGLFFPENRWKELRKGISSAAKEFNYEDVGSFVQWLMSSSLTKSQIEILAAHLTIGETHFFRDNKVFDILKEQILPELIHSRLGANKSLRLWSAGCSTGEEPYSIAILLDRMIPDLKNWNINILTNDINARSLKKMSEGVYGNWSFRDTPAWVKARYFKRLNDGSYSIDPKVKKLVKLSYLNLVEDAYPSLMNNTNAMDVIFCRNVLMYFTPECARKVIDRLYRSLAEGGWLIVSPSDAPDQSYSKFVIVNYPGAILYRKDGRQVGKKRGFEPAATPSVPVPIFTQEQEFQLETHLNVQTETLDNPPPQPVEPPAQTRKEPGPNPSAYEKALELYELGHYSEAVEILLQLLPDNQDGSDVMTLLSRAYANQGDLDKALEWCEKAIDADRLDPFFRYLAAKIAQERGQFESARTSLRQVLYLDQNFVLAHFALGNLNRQVGKIKESAKCFENAVSLLNAMEPETIIPESGGLTAGRLKEVIALQAG